jgi:hypothetical protein
MYVVSKLSDFGNIGNPEPAITREEIIVLTNDVGGGFG